jgi:hypothetical protein
VCSGRVGDEDSHRKNFSQHAIDGVSGRSA